MRFTSALAALCLAPTMIAAQTDQSIEAAVGSITAEDVARRVHVLAADSMRGRNTPSPELETAAQYIAAEFQRFGLAPGGDNGTFLQRYPIAQVALDLENSHIRLSDGTIWRIGEQLLVGGGEGQATGVPYLLSGGRGDASVLEGIPDGSVLLVASPIQALGPLFGPMQQREFAAILIVRDASPAIWERRAQAQQRPQPRVGATDASTLFFWLRSDAVRTMLTDLGVDSTIVAGGTETPFAVTRLDGVEMNATLSYETISEQSAPNVVGILEGSDPTLKDEYIVFSAHMDHSGTADQGNCAAKGADSICNGADDNASGTVAIVELAEAFVALRPRPKRSMVFLTVSGEEKGLWGSSHFAANPPVPIEQMVANVNADMVGRNWPDTIVVIGKEHSDLGATLERVSAAHPELNMTPIDDLWPEENFYGRSDHINFARRGVPILFFFNGTHEDYHQVTDEPEKIDAEKEARIVQLMLYLGIEIGNAAERPKWNPESYERVVS
jgi:hypothetical protein